MAAENCSNLIVQKIKASNLHYRLSENAFSLQIMIRKKFIDNHIPNYSSDKFESKIKDLEDKLANKTEECDIIKTEAKNVKEELAKISEELHETKVELTKTHSNTRSEKSKFEKNLKPPKEQLRRKKWNLKKI